MVAPTTRKVEAAALEEEDPVEKAFRDAPLDTMAETDAERAMMEAARAEPHAWISDDEHRAALAERIRRER